MFESRSFAFITNEADYPDPFLIEMSRRTQLRHSSVSYFDPNVLYCSPDMNKILEEIQDNRFFFSRKYWTAMMDKLVLILEDQYYWRKETIHNCLVHVIVYEELIFFHKEKKETRSLTKKLENIFSNAMDIREKRMENESHFSNTFVFDCTRSLQELRYAIAKHKK